MISKPAATERPIHELLAERWSGRAFDATRAVGREELIALLEAARWAPSCFGDQPWRFLVLDRHRQPERWQRGFACLVEGNRRWAEAAPVLIAACADGCFHAREEANRWGQYDTGAAALSLAVEATALGLMVHQMGGFDPAALRQAFDIPARYEPMAMIAVGYQLPEARIPEAQRERELAPRARRPLDECFFEGAWSEPVAR